MSLTILRALALDAFYQVLDNKVFRILAALACLCILLTFAVGFREDGMVVLWGLKRFAWEDMSLGLFGVSDADQPDVHVEIINAIQSFFVEQLAGNVGMVLVIAATSFFVPRMLEKGAADTLFSKPVSRLMLYIATFVTGLLFVLLLTGFLVVGMSLGFRVQSGHTDLGILWGAVTLTYAYALIFPVVMLVGVFTRSTVASILLGLTFFMGNGLACQRGWVAKEQLVWMDETGMWDQLIIEQHGDSDEPDIEFDDDEEDEGYGAFLNTMIVIADVLHYPSPKTYDADILTQMLRTRVEGSQPAYEDLETGLSVARLPEDYVEESVEAPAGMTVLLAARAPDLAGAPSLVLSKRDARQIERKNIPGKTRNERASEAVEQLLESLRARDGVEVLETDRRTLGSQITQEVLWASGTGEERRVHRSNVGSFQGEVFLAEASVGLESEDPLAASHLLDPLTELVAVAPMQYNESMADWYRRRFSWSGPLGYNAFFSIGSSLAFVMLILGLGWWKLSRIDF